MRVVQGGAAPDANTAAIGVGTPAATAVFPWANTGLAVRNARGELWFHEMPGEPTSPPRRLPGPPPRRARCTAPRGVSLVPPRPTPS